MTDVFGKPEKLATKHRLIAIAEEALRAEGWMVAKAHGSGKASLRRLTKGKLSKLAAIRTTQDMWVGIDRSADGKDWSIGDIDYLVVASVDDCDQPRFARVHTIPADEARARFNAAHARRKQAGRALQNDRGIWISLYHDDDGSPQYAGAGLASAKGAKQIADVPLDADAGSGGKGGAASATSDANDAPGPALTIQQAKRGLALGLGVPESAIEITIRH